MANQLNSYFVVLIMGGGDAIPVFPVSPDTNLSVGFHINETEVRQIFRKCNPRKCPGPDKIWGNVFNNCAVQLAPVFTNIFRASYHSGYRFCLMKNIRNNSSGESF